MKFYSLLFISFFCLTNAVFAQDKTTKDIAPDSLAITTVPEIPYHQIPDYPEKITAGTSIGRILDGLGYRYYWATKDLTEKDLAFEPGNEGRPAKDVLEHLHGLSDMIRNTAKKLPNIRPRPALNMTWEEQRIATLNNIKAASDVFKASSAEEINEMEIIFQRGDTQNTVPVWHLFNGPIDDAISHVGQITSYRRSAGNPINPFVNVFMGKTKESNK